MIPTDPGTSLEDNTRTPIRLSGSTGLHKRFKNLYDMFSGAISADNIDQSDNYHWTGFNDFSSGRFQIQGTSPSADTLYSSNSGLARSHTFPAVSGTLVNDNYGKLSAYSPNWINNCSLSAATTSTSNDSIKLTSYDGTSLSSTVKTFFSIPDDVTPGRLEKFTLTSDITLKISGAHWGADGKGDLTGAILRVGLINDGGATPALAVYYVGGRTSVASTSCSATQSDINLPEEVLVNRSLSVGTWPIQEIGYFKADFTDSTNVWAIDTSEIWLGKSADGLWQQFKITHSGFSVAPSYSAYWTQHGATCFLNYYGSTGTSNSTNLSITLPVSCTGIHTATCFDATDNSVKLTTPAMAYTGGALTCSIYKGVNSSTTWTNVGSKSAGIFNLTYEILI